MIGIRWSPALVLLAFATVGCGAGAGDAEQGEEVAGEAAADPDVAPAGEPMALPAGYAMRLDREGANAADFHVMSMGGGLHVQTGPAGILFNAADAVEAGDYAVSATFTEVGAPANHREAYGIFTGGSDLDGMAQRYTYFLVRADGQYLIKRRLGAETANVTDGWTPHEAVRASAGDGDVENALSVRVTGDQVHFAVNGTEVAVLPASEVDTHGVAGARINHNLNVMVNDWAVAR